MILRLINWLVGALSVAIYNLVYLGKLRQGYLYNSSVGMIDMVVSTVMTALSQKYDTHCVGLVTISVYQNEGKISYSLVASINVHKLTSLKQILTTILDHLNKQEKMPHDGVTNLKESK